MSFFKAFKDEYTGSNVKYITKGKTYQVINFDFLDDYYEFSIIDDLGEELWVSDRGEFDFKNTFYKVKVFNMNYRNGVITTS